MSIGNVVIATTSTLSTMWISFVNFLPSLLGALVLFLIGLIISTGIGELVERIIDALKIDRILEKIGFKKFTDRANIRLDAGYFIGQLIRWSLVLAFLSAALDSLGLLAFTAYLQSILVYLPNVIIAALIILVTLLVADFVEKLVVSSATGSGLKLSSFAGVIAKWAIYITGFLTALDQLRIASSYLSIIFIGLVAMLSLAGGLAFGLGGKDFAKHILEKSKKEFKD